MKLFCPECQARFDDTALQTCPEDGSKLFLLDATVEDPLLGAQIDGRFRIDGLIGRGGMGAVYRGTQLSVGRSVAIKVLRPEFLDQEIALERFYRESKIISELSHPNIVRLIDFGQDRQRNLLYLVMELIDGVEIGKLLEHGRFQLPLALEILYQVCGALTEPHMRDVIHRDLKPDNLLAVPISDGTLQVKVLDFGIARASEANVQITSTGMVCGTPQYMAPEQAQNLEMSARTDLYSLGVILYEMLSGTPPFNGQNSLQIMLQQVQMAPPALSMHLGPRELPLEVDALVRDMMSKKSLSRPESAREVRERIDLIRSKYAIEPVRLYPDVDRMAMFEPWLSPKVSALVAAARQASQAGNNLATPEPMFLDPTQDQVSALTAPISKQGAQGIRKDHEDSLPKPLAAIKTPSTEVVVRQDSAPQLGQVNTRPDLLTPAEQPALPPKSQSSSLLLFGSAGAVFMGILVAIIAVVMLLVFLQDSDPDGTPAPQIVEKIIERQIAVPFAVPTPQAQPSIDPVIKALPRQKSEPKVALPTPEPQQIPEKPEVLDAPKALEPVHGTKKTEPVKHTPPKTILASEPAPP